MIVTATAALAACAESQTPDTSDALIYGGKPVEGDKWTSAVALRMGGGLCTGTVVAPRLIITAAHCLDGKPASTQVTVTVGNKIQGGTAYQGERFAINPAYVDNAPTDIAYVLTKEPMRGVEIIPVLTDPSEIAQLLAVGAPSTMVGFGTTNAGSIGTKHEVTTTVGQSQGGALFIGGGGKDSCQGDSGGPAYGQLPNGQWRVYGITSRGNGCGGGGLLARMHDGLCWIQKDSGIAVPGSKLKCEGVINVPGGGSELSLLLAEADANDAAVAAIAAPKSVVSAALCFGSLAVCKSGTSIDVRFEKSSKSTADRLFFTSSATLNLRQGLQLTLLGMDAAGKVLDATAVELQRQ